MFCGWEGRSGVALAMRHRLSGLSTCTYTGSKANKKVKGDLVHRVSQLRHVTCHMESHGVACHPTQVNAPRGR